MQPGVPLASSSFWCLPTCVSPVPAPRELRELDPQSCACICRCRGPLLAGHGQDVRSSQQRGAYNAQWPREQEGDGTVPRGKGI